MIFRLGDVLSITTDRLLSRDHMGGVYRILNHMTGDDLMTHQLPRAGRECRRPLLQQHPCLADIEVPEFSGTDEVWAWLDEMETEYGDEFHVEPLDDVDHTRINPLDELSMNYPHLDVIVVDPQDSRYD